MRNGSASRIWRPLAVAIGLVIAVVLIGGSYLAWNRAQGQGAEANKAREVWAELEISDTRSSMERAFLIEMNALVLNGMGAGSGAELKLASNNRVAVTNEAQVTLKRLATDEGNVGGDARLLLDYLENSSVRWPRVPTANDLSNAAATVRKESQRYEKSSAARAADDFAAVAAYPQFILLEAAATTYLYTGDPPAPHVADFVEYNATKINAGLSYDLEIGEGTVVTEQADSQKYNTETEAIRDIFVASELAEVDLWIDRVGFSTIVLPPAFELDELASLANTATAQLTGIADDVLANEAAESEKAISDARSTRISLMALAALLLTLGLSLFVVTAASLAKLTRNWNQRAKIAMVDRLTGLGNRYLLDEQIRPAVGNSAFRSHVVVMFDLDRFKLINDTHGHQAGDDILVEFSKRLRGRAVEFESWDRDLETSIVRMGGDEILLSMHSTGPIEVERVRLRLEQMSDPQLVLNNGTLITLDFSIGLVQCWAPAELDEMIVAADLDLYRNKANRAKQGMGRSRPLPRASGTGGSRSKKASSKKALRESKR